MQPYKELMRHILENGVEKKDRTGTGTLSVFGHQMRFSLSDNRLPLVTGKFTSFKNIRTELLWFIKGECHVRNSIDFLHERGCGIWDEWVLADRSLGPIYGTQWRRWANINDDQKDIDQLAEVIQELRRNPMSRRLIVSAWRPDEIEEMALPPCHVMFQFYSPDGVHLSCQLYQRSCDVFLGVPYNIASYSLLTHMVAQVVGMKAHEFIWTGGDAHLYLNHLEQANEYLNRPIHPWPRLVLNPSIRNIDDFTDDDIQLEGYVYEPAIKAEVAV